MKRLIAPLVLVVAVVVALVVTRGRGNGVGSAEPVAPSLTIPRLGGGDAFQLASVNAAGKPTLLWFWAPWCPVCNAEAPNVEALAQGPGRASRSAAATTRRTAPRSSPSTASRRRRVLFDEAMASWQHYAIVGQPGAVLLDRDGRERARWSGPLDNAEVLAAARAL